MRGVWSAAALAAALIAAAPAAAVQTDPPTQQSTERKLTRRERKDLLAKLPEKYRQFLDEVAAIMQPNEHDSFLLLETDQQRDRYIDDFWTRRDKAAGLTNFAVRDRYYERVEQARERFKSIVADRARMLLIHGEPTAVRPFECMKVVVPLEIWTYEHIPHMGSDVRFLFYLPMFAQEYRLWQPTMNEDLSYGELAAADIRAVARNLEIAGMMVRGGLRDCINGDEVLAATGHSLQNKSEMMRVYETPAVQDEEAKSILRSMVIANPTAPKLPAEFSARFPGKQGARTDAELTVLVPRASLTAKDVGKATVYSIDVTGEVLRDDKLYETFRYRFDFPGDATDENCR